MSDGASPDSSAIKYLNEDDIGRLPAKVATYFSECVLAKSSISGGGDKSPLNSTILLKSQFTNESPTEFETKWAKCTANTYIVVENNFNKKANNSGQNLMLYQL